MKFLSVLNVILLILAVVLGILVWQTASQVYAILFGVVLLIGGLNITGVLGSLFGVTKASKPVEDVEVPLTSGLEQSVRDREVTPSNPDAQI